MPHRFDSCASRSYDTVVRPRSVLVAGHVAVALGGFGCGSRTELGVFGDGSASAADAAMPGADSGVGCNDGGPLELAYALDDRGVIHRLDPRTGQDTALGMPSCRSGDGNVQWTFTASRDRGYVIYTDGALYTVDLSTLACAPTSFQPGQLGLDTESGFAAAGSGASERLYFYGVPRLTPSPILVVCDTTAFICTKIGDIAPVPPGSSYPVNLTADSAGRLYAFSPRGLVEEIDPASGAVLQAVDTGVTSSGTWATIAYGTDLYLWVQSSLVGYDLATRTRTSTRDLGVAAIGAASFTGCTAP